MPLPAVTGNASNAPPSAPPAPAAESGGSGGSAPAAESPSGLPGAFKDGFESAPAQKPGSNPALTAPAISEGTPKTAEAAATVAAATTTPAAALAMTRETKAAYDALPQDQRDEYDAISRALTTASKPDAVSALETALRSGVLRDRAEEDGRTVLDHLAPLAEGGKTRLGVDRTELLAQALKDVADPESAILQGPKNKECAGTAVSYVMAKQSPASYVRANVGLAEEGEVRIGSPYLRRPAMLRLNPWEPLQLTADRPITQQLAGEAFMQRAAGPSASPRDTFFDGLTGDKVADTFSHLFGRPTEAMYLPDAKEEPNERLRTQARQEARSVLEAELQAGTLPMANYNGHWCVVSEADPRQANVTVVDGEGNKVDIPWEQFLDGLDTLVYDRNIYQTSDYVKAHPEWGRPGSGGGVINQTNGSSDAR